jgi:chromate transporter
LVLIATGLLWLTRIHLLWVLVAGAAIGGLGWV